jgi:hypothetical protein
MRSRNQAAGRPSLYVDEALLVVGIEIWMDVRVYHMGRGACIGWALSLALYNQLFTDQSLLTTHTSGIFREACQTLELWARGKPRSVRLLYMTRMVV